MSERVELVSKGSITINYCRLRDGQSCNYEGERPSGAWDWNLPDGRPSCRVVSGSRVNLERCDIGSQEENIVTETLELVGEPGSRLVE